MRIIKHNIENVSFHTLTKFLSEVEECIGINPDELIHYDEDNRGVTIIKSNGDEKLISWVELAEMMGWFDDAEIVTDAKDNERVMTWFNLD